MRTRKVSGAFMAAIVVVALAVVGVPSRAGAAPSRTINLGGPNVIGLEFEKGSYFGTVLTVYGDFCTSTTSDIDWATTDLPYGGTWPFNWWWDNTITSFKNEDNCFTRHFTDENFNGAADPVYSDDRQDMVNGMDNVTNSIRWS